MEDLLNDFLADIEKELKEIHINKQMGDGMITTCNIIFAYLMSRYMRTQRLFANKEISYIEYKVADKIDEEISAIMNKIAYICNQKVERNEVDI